MSWQDGKAKGLESKSKHCLWRCDLGLLSEKQKQKILMRMYMIFYGTLYFYIFFIAVLFLLTPFKMEDSLFQTTLFLF